MISTTYLYLWNDIEHRSLVASGLRFSDFTPHLRDKGGLVLLRHHFEGGRRDGASGFVHVETSEFHSLENADIYSWGDFYWADHAATSFPHLTADDVSELRYFCDEALPKRGARIESLGNNFLVAAHDDGWYVRAFYSDWSVVAPIVHARASELDGQKLLALEQGTSGFWIQNGQASMEEKTFDVDAVINRNLERARQKKT